MYVYYLHREKTQLLIEMNFSYTFLKASIFLKIISIDCILINMGYNLQSSEE